MLNVYIPLIWFMSSLLNGITSFGGNLLGIPLVSMFLEPREAIVMGCATGAVMTLSLGLIYRHSLPKLEFVVITLTSIVGTYLGSFVLQRAPSGLLLICAGVVLACFLLWQFVSRRLHFSVNLPLWSMFPAGILHGFVQGATGMGGPVLAIYTLLRNWDKETTISTLNLSAAISLGVLAFNQWRDGLYTSNIVELLPIGMTGSIVGSLVSVLVVRRLRTEVFKKIMLLMLCVFTVVLLSRGTMML